MILNVKDRSHMSTLGAVEEDISIALPKGLKLGEYRILRAIGQGGFGITYLAEHVDTKKEYVIKENMPASFSRRDERTYKVTPTGTEMVSTFEWALDRFLQEARTLSKLQHPNIVRVKTAFKALGTAYYVMDCIKGRELHEAAPPPGQITEAWLRPVLEEILKALHYVHSQNLLHRDIKPNNILVDENCHPVLIDFGTARELVSERTATMVESAGYTPLEQLQSRAKRGAWTDIYALGCTMYRVITGENPPRSIDRLSDDSCRKLAEDRSLMPRFSRGFLQSVDKALAVQARNRWQDTQEWLKGMNGVAFSVPEIEPLPLAPPPSPYLPPSLPPVTAQRPFPVSGGAYPQPAVVNMPPVSAGAYPQPLVVNIPPVSVGAYPQSPVVNMPAPYASLKKRSFFRGRCGLGMWWLHMLIVFVLFLIGGAMEHDASGILVILALVLYLCAMVRRCNDLGHSGWWTIPYVLLSCVVIAALSESGEEDAEAFVGMLSLIILPGCIPGQKMPNKYGV